MKKRICIGLGVLGLIVAGALEAVHFVYTATFGTGAK